LILLEFLPLYFSTEIGDNNSMEMRNEIKVGDVVKSLDFVGVNDCFYVGLVTEILNDGRFRAKAIKRVWKGEADKRPLADEFFAPLPGYDFFDDMAEWKDAAPRIQVVA
jgi:hypothetical protein